GLCAGLIDGSETLDFFFFVDLGSAVSTFMLVESVVAVAFSVDRCVVLGEDAPRFDFGEPVDETPDTVDDDPGPEAAPVSANATPCPTRTAAPIPRAAASPPLRQMYALASMHLYIPPVQRAHPRLGGNRRRLPGGRQN
ncbi:hypothetical protein, partial [Mycolicibacterium sp. CBMA 361]